MSRLLSTFCIWFGHSRIVRTCLYEVSCARCGDRIGDNLMGTVDLTHRVIVGHGCDECRTNWSRLGWRDKLFAPRKRSVLCIGPCFDFCMCSHCWWGWDRLPWWRKILRRIQWIATEGW